MRFYEFGINGRSVQCWHFATFSGKAVTFRGVDALRLVEQPFIATVTLVRTGTKMLKKILTATLSTLKHFETCCDGKTINFGVTMLHYTT